MRFALAGFTPAISVIREEGYLFFWVARKIWLRAGGIIVYPLEIESVIYSTPIFSKPPSSACPIRSGARLESGDRVER